MRRGIQADQCYYFEPEKLAAVKAAWARKAKKIADYPNPDLAIEVDVSDPKIDRADIYSKLRVAEIWWFDGQTVVFEQLQDDGSYAPPKKAAFFPCGRRTSFAGSSMKITAMSWRGNAVWTRGRKRCAA